MFQLEEVSKIAASYSGHTGKAVFLSESHNIVYKIEGVENFILRFTAQTHRKKDEILAELEFLQYLYENGLPVVPPIPDKNGEFLCEITSEGKTYYAAAFALAEGEGWRERDPDNSKERLIQIGKAIGKIHRLSRNYQPVGVQKRREWYKNDHLIKANKLFAEFNSLLKTAFEQFIGTMNRLPKDSKNYGLIHGDFLFSNYNITKDNKLSIFDFDECEYSWYLYDIAVCMYYYLLGGKPEELHTKEEEAEEMLCYLLLGYQSETPILKAELCSIDMFLQLRDYVLLSNVLEKRSYETSNWAKAFLEGAIDRLINQKKFIPLGIENIINRLG